MLKPCIDLPSWSVLLSEFWQILVCQPLAQLLWPWYDLTHWTDGVSPVPGRSAQAKSFGQYLRKYCNWASLSHRSAWVDSEMSFWLDPLCCVFRRSLAVSYLWLGKTKKWGENKRLEQRQWVLGGINASKNTFSFSLSLLHLTCI